MTHRQTVPTDAGYVLIPVPTLAIIAASAEIVVATPSKRSATAILHVL